MASTVETPIPGEWLGLKINVLASYETAIPTIDYLKYSDCSKYEQISDDYSKRCA